MAARYSKKKLLNLGANFIIPKVQWAELVEIIEAMLAGNEFLFEPAPELTATAEAIVQKLRRREMVQAADEAPLCNALQTYLVRTANSAIFRPNKLRLSRGSKPN